MMKNMKSRDLGNTNDGMNEKKKSELFVKRNRYVCGEKEICLFISFSD
jgi:hypothetical protein